MLPYLRRAERRLRVSHGSGRTTPIVPYRLTDCDEIGASGGERLYIRESLCVADAGHHKDFRPPGDAFANFGSRCAAGIRVKVAKEQIIHVFFGHTHRIVFRPHRACADDPLRLHALDCIVERVFERWAAAVDMDTVGVAAGSELRIVGNEERGAARLHEGREGLYDSLGIRLIARGEDDENTGDIAGIESGCKERRKTRGLGERRRDEVKTRRRSNVVIGHSSCPRSRSVHGESTKNTAKARPLKRLAGPAAHSEVAALAQTAADPARLLLVEHPVRPGSRIAAACRKKTCLCPAMALVSAKLFLRDRVLSTRIQDRYRARLQEGLLERDAAQEAIARRLDRLLDELVEYRLARKSSPLGWLFGRRMTGPPRGLYLFGAVGGGKTMLMDLFFDAAPARRKRRVHFHAFMADVHARIHDWRQRLKQGLVKGEDPIARVAAALASEAWLLCFDEFSVSDIADAMILGRLFQAMFAAGVVVVATSNVAPQRLYEGGLNRALFLPFIGLLEQRMEVCELASRTDFRLEKLSGAPVYHVPADTKARVALGRAFTALTGAARGTPLVLPVFGRRLVVPEAAANVARFSFSELCERPLAAADYLVVARRFHTLLIDGIPVLLQHQRNEAKRFIILIDALYDQRVKLIASAEAEPQDLYLGRDGREAFEFVRTASRIIEMRSQDYLALPHGTDAPAASGHTCGLVQT